MAVKRIVPNIAAERTGDAIGFYRDLLGLRVAMDHGWIMTFVADGNATPQLSVATEGGSGAQVPDISIEVDDLDDVLARFAAAGVPIDYGPAHEPWGVRRFFVRDPYGRLLNILAHD